MAFWVDGFDDDEGGMKEVIRSVQPGSDLNVLDHIISRLSRAGFWLVLFSCGGCDSGACGGVGEDKGLK